MDPYIQQWSQSEDAQQYLQQAMQNLGMSQQGGMGGYGTSTSDPYGAYLQRLIAANTANPGLQEELLGYYLDYANPMNQQQTGGIDENMANIALSLMSSDNPEAFEMGMELIKNMIPQVAQGPEEDPLQGYGVEDFQKVALRNRYQPMLESETNPEKMALYNLLASGDEGARSAYYGAEPSFWDRLKDWAVPFEGRSWWNAEAGRRSREKAVKNAYGL